MTNKSFLRGFRIVAILTLFYLLLPSCSSIRRTADTTPLKNRNTAFLLKKLNNNYIDAEWLSTRASVKFTSSEEIRSFTSYIRLKKDSLIWMNFKKSSIEAARILITPDSFFLINRLDKAYLAESFAFLQDKMALPLSNDNDITPFQALQNLLLGNPVFPAVKKFTADSHLGYYMLAGQSDDLESRYLLDGKEYTLQEIQFEDKKFNRSLQFFFGAYEPLEEANNFSYFRSIYLNTPEDGTVSLELKLTKAAFHAPKNIQFEIPTHYERMVQGQY